MLKTDTCSLMGPEWTCKNTLGSFRCVRKRGCTGPDCGVQRSSAVKCPRGHEIDANNRCIGTCPSGLGPRNAVLTIHLFFFFSFRVQTSTNATREPGVCPTKSASTPTAVTIVCRGRGISRDERTCVSNAHVTYGGNGVR